MASLNTKLICGCSDEACGVVVSTFVMVKVNVWRVHRQLNRLGIQQPLRRVVDVAAGNQRAR